MYLDDTRWYPAYLVYLPHSNGVYYKSLERTLGLWPRQKYLCIQWINCDRIDDFKDIQRPKLMRSHKRFLKLLLKPQIFGKNKISPLKIFATSSLAYEFEIFGIRRLTQKTYVLLHLNSSMSYKFCGEGRVPGSWHLLECMWYPMYVFRLFSQVYPLPRVFISNQKKLGPC